MPRPKTAKPASFATAAALREEWLSVEEVLVLLSVRPGKPLGRSTLDGWRKTRGFPAPRRLPNGNLRHRLSEVAEWLDALPMAA